jgi:hypothetical protein
MLHSGYTGGLELATVTSGLGTMLSEARSCCLLQASSYKMLKLSSSVLQMAIGLETGFELVCE